jgi:oligoribonuclease
VPATPSPKLSPKPIPSSKTSMQSDLKTNLVWMDLEMTGFDPEIHAVTQISLVITNSELEVLYEGTEINIHQPEVVLDNASGWVKENAKDILQKSRASTVSIQEAENQLLQTIQKYTAEKCSPLCGNSVWQDRRFIAKYFPKIDNYLLHRIIDISSIKELCKRWRPGEKVFEKKNTHTAFDDIKESIAELKYYREIGFIG